MVQAEDGIRDTSVTGVQTCALPISNALQERWERLRSHKRIISRVKLLVEWDQGGTKESANAVTVDVSHSGCMAVVGADLPLHRRVRSEERRVGKEWRARWSRYGSSRRRHTRYIGDWSSDVCSSDLQRPAREMGEIAEPQAYHFARQAPGGVGPGRDQGERQRCHRGCEPFWLYGRGGGGPPAAQAREIGRASCRERVESAVVEVWFKQKTAYEIHR